MLISEGAGANSLFVRQFPHTEEEERHDNELVELLIEDLVTDDEDDAMTKFKNTARCLIEGLTANEDKLIECSKEMKALIDGTEDCEGKDNDVGFFDLACDLFEGCLVFLTIKVSASPYLGPNEHNLHNDLHAGDVKLAFVSKSAICKFVRTYFM